MNINNISATIVKKMSPETTVPVSVISKAESQISEDNRQAVIEAQESPFSKNETKQMTSELNEIMDDLRTELGFSIREDLDHTVIVEIKNQETNELIKQIPSEELLTIKEKMLELTGLLLDQSV